MAFFVYVEKKGRRQGANGPQGAEDVWVIVCLNQNGQVGSQR